MTSSIGVKSGFARHGRAIASVILFQTLLIIWLSSWAIGDYSNNQYVRAYVDSTVQSMAWIFGAVVVIGVLGSVLGLIVRRRRGTSLELVGVSPKVPLSTPMAKSVPSVSRVSVPVSRHTAVPAPSVTTVSATGTTMTAPVPAVELHPAVAALKAELSEARMSLGLASVTTGPQTAIGPANRFDDQRNLQGAPARSQTVNPPGMSPRPQNSAMNQTLPPTVIRPMSPNSNPNVTPTLAVRPPTPPTVIRPMIPSSGQSVQPMTSPMLRPPAPSQQTPQPVGVPSRPQTMPPTPKDVSTVITGIMPVIKKKDEQASSAEQNNNAQN